MKVILLQDIDKVGFKHDVVKVKPGYGRNFILPKKLGILANAPNMAKLDKIKDEEAAKELARLDEYKEMAAKLEGKTLKIGVKSGTSGKIFGSVTNIQLSAALKEQLELEIDRKKVELPDDIKEIGTYTAVLNLHPEVQSNIDFELVSE